MYNFIVYKHTCPNGKVYIGMTRRSIRERISSGYSNNKHFSRAIQKYGWNNILTEILFENLDEVTAKLREIEEIASCKANNPEFGYNISSGGESHNGCNFNHTDDAKRKISEHNCRYWTGKKRPKLSATHAEKLLNSRKIKVQCLETGQIFDSITEARKVTGANHIDGCIRGKFKSSGNLHWRSVGGEFNS